MFRTIRHWLILKLAGNDTIVVNATVDGGIKSHASRPTVVANCTFYLDSPVLGSDLVGAIDRAYEKHIKRMTHANPTPTPD
jgi:hypothetical protein